MGKRELIALIILSSWCLVMVERLFFAVPRGCLQFVIVVFPDHTHLLFLPYVGQKLLLLKQFFLLWQGLTSALMFHFWISTNIVNKKGNFKN